MALYDETYVNYDDTDYYVIPDYPCPESESDALQHVEGPHCNSTHDTVICWPASPAGHVVYARCPAFHGGITLNQDANASKLCSVNGTWLRADYDPCMLKNNPEVERIARDAMHNLATRIILGVGFSISTAALVTALAIFLYFRSLRCLRNKIHCHLMFSFVIKNILWVTLHSFTPFLTRGDDFIDVSQSDKSAEDEFTGHSDYFMWSCKVLVSLYYYIQSTNYFWMLVEGLYLHIMIVYAYSVDKMRLWVFSIIGWGLPVIFVVAWACVKYYKDNHLCWLPLTNLYYDFIYITPILLVLLLNTLCLVSTVYIIVTKLSASNTPQARQFWQTLKGTLILFPLLGVIYVVLITPPSSNPVARHLFHYFNVIAHSSQGFIVAVFYCFLNREVRQVLRNRMSRYRDSRSLAVARTTRTSISMKHDPSIMLVEMRPSHHSKRPSIISTSPSLLSNRPSNDTPSNGNAKHAISNGNSNSHKSSNGYSDSESGKVLDTNGTNGNGKSEALTTRMNGVRRMNSLEEEYSHEKSPMLGNRKTST